VITPTFSVIPQSPTHVRIIYRSMYCLDLQCRGSNLVSVRDGAYSMFESNKAVEGLNPIPNLQVIIIYGNAFFQIGWHEITQLLIIST